ncbi:MAG TPA: lactate utilization protein C [Candidatus Limnocylindrales bacterium]|nr:lactate utilization protein C [Candidatus Limnocylindrales bacterium]
MTAREEILDRIRASLADLPPVPDVPRAYRTTTDDRVDLVGLLADRLADYRALIHRCGAAELPSVVADALARRGARRIVVPGGVDPAWLSATAVEAVGDVPALSHTELDRLDGVLTGCAVAIAETGTIVLDGSPDQGRRALSLLPDYHLCVVPTERIVGSVPEALGRLDPTRPLTWISGPSATSDIELQRVEGVHGPRTLEVVIVE